MPNKTTLFFAAVGLFFGALLGAGQYWEDIKTHAFPKPARASWQLTELNTQIMNDTANIEQLEALNPPSPSAEDIQWTQFLNRLGQVDTGKRYRASSATSPLLAWYAYIAKHHPGTLYQALGEQTLDQSTFNHLLQTGFLRDWYQHTDNADQLLLTSTDALMAFALTEGQSIAQQKVVSAFFAIAKNPPRETKIPLRLQNLRFAFDAMTSDEQKTLLPFLREGPFRIDPREVDQLTLIPELDRDQLLALIKKFAYPNRSMSSYMTTGAILGEAQYVSSMIDDIQDNAKQPTNFYCSFCGLALSTEGLLGRPLLEARAKRSLKITPSEKHGFVLSRGLSSQASMEWVDEQ